MVIQSLQLPTASKGEIFRDLAYYPGQACTRWRTEAGPLLGEDSWKNGQDSSGHQDTITMHFN